MQQPAFTITASHPLLWCDRDGSTVRCLTVAESALLMGFPPGWQLPSGSRVGLRAVGNAVPPPLAHAVMACSKAHAGPAAPPPSPPHEPAAASHELVEARPGPADAAAPHEPSEPSEAAPSAVEPSEPSEPSRPASPAPPESEEPLEPAPSEPPAQPKRRVGDNDALAGLRRKLRRLARRVEALEDAVDTQQEQEDDEAYA